MPNSTIHRAIARLAQAAAAAAGIGALTPLGLAQCYYEVTVLEGPDCGPLGPAGSRAFAINNLGHVTGCVGQCDIDGGCDVLDYTGGPGFETLIPPFAGVYNAEGRGISSTGLIVGTMDISGVGQRGFAYENGAWTALAPIDGGHAAAFAVNSAGQVVGYRDVAAGTIRTAFIWQDDVFTDVLPRLDPSLGDSIIALDVNDSGRMVGYFNVPPDYADRPFQWENGLRVDLELPTGATAAKAQAINGAGLIVGSATVPDWLGGQNASHVVAWENGEPTDLGGLGGFRFCGAWDVSDDGVVVGFCAYTASNINERAAFLWKDGMLIDLDDLIDPALGLHVVSANSINNQGQIAGFLTGDGVQATSAFILTPPNPTDLTGDCITDIEDLLVLLADWGSAGSPADFDGSGQVDIVDLLFLLGHWS